MSNVGGWLNRSSSCLKSLCPRCVFLIRLLGAYSTSDGGESGCRGERTSGLCDSHFASPARTFRSSTRGRLDCREWRRGLSMGGDRSSIFGFFVCGSCGIDSSSHSSDGTRLSVPLCFSSVCPLRVCWRWLCGRRSWSSMEEDVGEGGGVEPTVSGVGMLMGTGRKVSIGWLALFSRSASRLRCSFFLSASSFPKVSGPQAEFGRAIIGTLCSLCLSFAGWSDWFRRTAGMEVGRETISARFVEWAEGSSDEWESTRGERGGLECVLFLSSPLSFCRSVLSFCFSVDVLPSAVNCSSFITGLRFLSFFASSFSSNFGVCFSFAFGESRLLRLFLSFSRKSCRDMSSSALSPLESVFTFGRSVDGSESGVRFLVRSSRSSLSASLSARRFSFSLRSSASLRSCLSFLRCSLSSAFFFSSMSCSGTSKSLNTSRESVAFWTALFSSPLSLVFFFASRLVFNSCNTRGLSVESLIVEVSACLGGRAPSFFSLPLGVFVSAFVDFDVAMCSVTVICAGKTGDEGR
ncbi:hypothetical protein BLNAU_20376 [Blattamonas nauphoetae]|uniref:Uncharacterized protein n=1 Tax=Blattamonas nauphoetae TaxID=2049346 RepID=A0ABQ9WZD8_9EUKA|nr:hypothetical protein BLNAU_20376 [Blattamonas nauphoetae]